MAIDQRVNMDAIIGAMLAEKKRGYEYAKQTGLANMVGSNYMKKPTAAPSGIADVIAMGSRGVKTQPPADNAWGREPGGPPMVQPGPGPRGAGDPIAPPPAAAPMLNIANLGAQKIDPMLLEQARRQGTLSQDQYDQIMAQMAGM